MAGLGSRCGLGGIAFGPVADVAMGRPNEAVDFFDVKGDVEALLARTPPSSQTSIRRFIPAAPPDRARTAKPSAGRRIASALRPPYELPGNPVVFEVEGERCYCGIADRRTAPGSRRRAAILSRSGKSVTSRRCKARRSDARQDVAVVCSTSSCRPKFTGSPPPSAKKSVAARAADDTQTLTDDTSTAFGGVEAAMECTAGGAPPGHS